MMTQLGPVGTVLSIVFALFTTVLFVELWYVWWSRQRRASLIEESMAVPAPAPPLKKQEQVSHIRAWALNVRNLCSFCGNQEGESSDSGAKRLATLCRRSPAVARSLVQGSCLDQEMGESGCEQKQQPTEEKVEEVEQPDDEDLLSLGGLWGPPRLLFTIREETTEEMRIEEARCSGAKVVVGERQLLGLVSCGSSSSTISGVFSDAASPFLTPPSSPPFATPFGSPAVTSADRPAPPCPTAEAKAEVEAEAEAEAYSASATSTSSSSPVLQNGCRRRPPLSVLSEDTSSSSSAATPAALSPPSASAASSMCSSPYERNEHPLCFELQDPIFSPSAAFLYNSHTNRVHPLMIAPQLQGLCDVGNEPRPSAPLPVLQKKSEESPQPFCLPPLSQPTTPCPFRSALFTKAGTRGAACSLALLRHHRLSPT